MATRKAATRRAPPNKGKTYPPETLTPEEVTALLVACSHRSPTGIRNAAIVATLWRSGIRCSELIALRPKDINHSAGHLQVLHGKGDKPRRPAIDDGALTRILRWEDARRALGIGANRPLFCTLQGGLLQSRYVRALLERLGRRAGITSDDPDDKRRVHPHILRHTLAYEWMMEGIPIVQIQHQLGHSNLAVTSIYLQHIAPKDLVAAARARPAWDEAS
jgi:site-specific recombinase XerD